MIRFVRGLQSILLLLPAMLPSLAGCNFTPYSYMATGRVLDSRGMPLKEVRVCLYAPDTPGLPNPRPFVHVVPTTLPSWVNDQFLESGICGG